MKFPSAQTIPVVIAAGVLAVVCLLQALPALWPRANFFQRLEWMTYDWRARYALKSAPPPDPRLGVVYVTEADIEELGQESWGGYGWPIPRKFYAMLVQELTAQGAVAVGFDVFFYDRVCDCGTSELRSTASEPRSSDDLFAQQLKRAGNVVLTAAVAEVSGERVRLKLPLDLFRTNAMAVAQDGVRAANRRDSDSVYRRTMAFVEGPDGQRIWHLGIVLAARLLKLDLERATTEPGRILLRGASGKEVVIPTEADNSFYIDWSIPVLHPRLKQEPLLQVLFQARGRTAGQPAPSEWEGKIVVVGSTGIGNNLADRGATPLSNETELFSSHWNVAQSVLTGRFVRRAGDGVELGLICVMTLAAAGLSWRWRALWASLGVAVIAAGYVWLGFWLYAQHRYWLPLALPVAGALLMTHVCMVAYRTVVEVAHQWLFSSTFGRLVSPNVFELVRRLRPREMAGTRRRVTIYFADLRGFTRFTDESHARAEEYVRQHKLTGREAEEHIDQAARDTLGTVNLYLSTIAETIKGHHGTVDKYIGDCVMSFWGAPITDERHALNCVKAAIAVHEALHTLNQQRVAQNRERARENQSRAAAGETPLSMLPVLKVGSGIHSGVATVGFMGSAEQLSNYTVFGREVNIASRLEHATQSDRILITQATYEEIKRDAPDIAATFLAQEPITLPGIRTPVPIYEVPWRLLADATKTDMGETGPVRGPNPTHER